MIAIISDTRYRMALALIRCLAENGVRIIVCESDDCQNNPAKPPLGFYSKYITEAHFLKNTSYNSDLLSLCYDIGSRFKQKPVLMPIGARSLNLMAEPNFRLQLAQAADFIVPDQAALDLLNDKQKMADLAKSLAIPCPSGFDEPLAPSFPCVVKPVCGEKLGLKAAERYLICHNDEQLKQAKKHFAPYQTTLIIQQYLAGSGLGCSVLANKGQIVDFICHRRIREYPIAGGPSSCCIAEHNPLLKDYAQRLTKAIGFSGLAMFEFKEDAAANPYFLEANPRVWGSFPLLRVAKSNLPLYWFYQAYQLSNPGFNINDLKVAAYKNKKMQFVFSDLMAGLNHFKQGNLRPALGAFIDTLNPAVKDGLFEFKDARPFRIYLKSIIKGR